MFLTPAELPASMEKARPNIERLQNLAKGNKIPIAALCLNFTLLNPFVSKVIIGVDSLEHLRGNVSGLNFADKTESITDELQELSIDDEQIVLPFKWSLG